MNVTEFKPEVVENLNYYVYRLIDPRNSKTFYVGKGKGNRVFNHIKTALSFNEKGDDAVSLKYDKIREIQKAKFQVKHIIHRHGMSENTAFEVESALIDAYGEDGELTNLVRGHKSDDFGMMTSEQIEEKYTAEEAVFKHNMILITINNYNHEVDDIYQKVRFSWKLSIKRARKSEYVLAVKNGIIIGVFKPLEWREATRENFPDFDHEVPDRVGFVGERASKEVQNLYLRKRVPKGFSKKGSANPVRYT
ncbi:hypothetical protein CGC48_01650 [Capnocytophaga cynodegmi]|uniref:GIY-YIG domain-containing protein n=2 Tax=Capnocytophaga cynodegmi TaxID=28189 RepID=A0A250E8E9_9FLAO|nr:hypothetical protein CGC48_01650 [Capnocytophaga cynodegmi]